MKLRLTYMFMFCLALSMSLLISGVMLNRSFWGMDRGTMGERTISVRCLWTTTPGKVNWPSVHRAAG